ncbi:membrane-binding protein [Flavobacterium sp. MAH-1]|uniref:Membrane-binding protein n=1 Tax=Flavobacterium agri TaxID=2743471 RepID=A0A7Y8Y149_9FLAO|nr:membrane-binding protein [Flavobacterium agri]NUY80652.1 membrane-binding protein [Flavobacterium agri]NYA70676.1 membrane-binding protein [Flavobacterium agri]
MAPTRLSQLFFVPILLLLFGSVSSQNQTASYYEPCSYYGEDVSHEIKMYPASEHAKKVINGIISVIGLRPNFEIREANVPNAAAVVLDSKRYILYNAEFMDDINTASGTYWAGISILAHEIGHHLNGHTLDSDGSRPDTELEADEFSGFVLNKMGASLKESQAAMAVAASQRASHTHPAKSDRLRAIALGWNTANGQDGTVSKNADSRRNVERPVVVKREVEQPVIEERRIAFDVSFTSDDGVYYITDQGHLINVEQDGFYLIGNLSESNKRGYKLMISDKNYNYLYIATGGGIENGVGKRVGTIRKHEF